MDPRELAWVLGWLAVLSRRIQDNQVLATFPAWVPCLAYAMTMLWPQHKRRAFSGPPHLGVQVFTAVMVDSVCCAASVAATVGLQ